MANEYSLQGVFRQYLESEIPPEPDRSIAQLIASGELSRESFDLLIKAQTHAADPNLWGAILDLALLFVRKCVDDHQLSHAEMEQAERLTAIFRIDEGDFFQFRHAEVQEIISAQATWIIEDHYVTDQEEVLQRDLQKLLGLSYDQYVGLLRPLIARHIAQLEDKRRAVQNRDELRSLDASIQNLRSVFLVPQ